MGATACCGPRHLDIWSSKGGKRTLQTSGAQTSRAPHAVVRLPAGQKPWVLGQR